MKKLVINSRDFGEVTTHMKNDKTHSFTILSGQVTVTIPIEHIKLYRSNYNYSITLKDSCNYVYQIIREYEDGTLEHMEGVYQKESDAIERANLSIRAYKTDFWKGTKYYNSKYHVIALEY